MTSSVAMLPELHLSLKPDAAEAQQRLRAYWQGEILDRACVSIRAPRDGADPPNGRSSWPRTSTCPPPSTASSNGPGEMFFGGEAMPALMPNYGPDQWAGFLGRKLTLAPEMDTSWAEPSIADWDEDVQWKIDPANVWWKAIVELSRLAGRRCAGKFISSTIDTHSNLDALCRAARPGPALHGPGGAPAGRAASRASSSMPCTSRSTARFSRPAAWASSAARRGWICGAKAARRPSSATSAA